MKKVSIVVVTYRSAPEVGEALASLGAHPRVAQGVYERIVVDNASGDETVVCVVEAAPNARLLPLEQNRGFATGANAGAAIARGEYLLFLNPDATLAPEGLDRLVDYLEQRPRVAAVGPQLVDSNHAPQPGARRFPTPSSEFARLWAPLASVVGWRHREPEVKEDGGPVDWISGACFLVRRDAWSHVGPMDSDFFLYFEETDWARRAWDKGWEVHHLPHAEAMHLGGTSTAREGELVSGCLVEHHRRSRRRYFRKHHGALGVAVVETLHALRRVYEAVRRRRVS